jgi:hypothetical protein
MDQGAAQPRIVPDHVPRELVRDFSIYNSPGLTPTPFGNPQAALSYVREYPPIFYSIRRRMLTTAAVLGWWSALRINAVS